jgi:beta-glucosidase
VDFYEETGTSHCKLGFEPYIPEDTTLQKAVALAGESEIVVLCLGLNKLLEGEANDRTDLGLPPEQVILLEKITAVNKNTIVVLNNGTPILMNDWIKKVPAILDALYPGQEGGNALAEILFGVVCPSGKLPFTFPQKWEDSPAYGTYPGIREEGIYKEGIFVGYRHFDKANIAPLFPFGFGLSYTRFDLKDLKLNRKTLTSKDTLTVSVSIKNAGNRDGDEVVQLYIQDIKASVEREVKSLKGFQRVSLHAGEERTVFFKINKDDLSFYDVSNKRWLAEQGRFKVLIGNSSRDVRLESGFDYIDNE